MESKAAKTSVQAPHPGAESANRIATPARLFGLFAIAIGIAGWWYNWHLAATEGQFYIKLCLFGPLGAAGGLLMLVRPEWAGPLRSDSTTAHKVALSMVIGLMAVGSGIDMYLLTHSRSPRPSFNVLAAGPASLPKSAMTFLDQNYRLGSFNQKQNPQWEFVTGNETVDNWSTLVTLIDRPDARSRPDLDRLAEGVMQTYKSHGGRILAARTMQDSGAVFNYMVAAFDEPGKQRYELNFVKMALGPKNAAVVIYSVRVTDPQDYRTRARDFVNLNSTGIGRALGSMALPDLSRLPRQPF